MSTLQISLIAVGVILLLASFFVTEKLSSKEVDELSRLSSAQLQKVVDKEMSGIEDRVTDIVGEAVDKATEELQRPMEELSNEKIMAIGEYSDTVMEDINKGHSEIVFLYNMMSEKQEELKGMLASIERNKAQLREMSDNVSVIERKTEKVVNERAAMATAEQADRVRTREEISAAEAAMDELLKEGESHMYGDQAATNEPAATGDPASDGDPARKDPGFVFRERDDEEDLPEASARESVSEKAELRKMIIGMYEEGLSDVEIGKRLRCGVGEVRLVIELLNRGERFEA